MSGQAANTKRGEVETSKQSHGLRVHSSGRESPHRALAAGSGKGHPGAAQSMLPLSLSPLHLL